MKNEPLKIAVTGGGGQLAYSLLFRLANGELIPSRKIVLSIRDVEENRRLLEALAMELEDCAFPNLAGIEIGSNPHEIFNGAEAIFLIGAKPRGPGMERRDLLLENAKIFVEEGRALNEAASPHARVLVVGNPCNTNCLIALSHAPKIPKENFHAMMRLDHNRAIGILAKKANVSPEAVRKMIIWGNHSASQVPDYSHVEIEGKPILDIISDRKWLNEEFVETVQRRGAAIIAARGKSSAGSAAHAALLAMKSLFEKTADNDWYSTAIWSEHNPYGIDESLVFGFPCRTRENQVEIVRDLKLDHFIREKIAITQKELIEERECVKSLLGVELKLHGR